MYDEESRLHGDQRLICSKCGAQVPPDAHFCPSCGVATVSLAAIQEVKPEQEPTQGSPPQGSPPQSPPLVPEAVQSFALGCRRLVVTAFIAVVGIIVVTIAGCAIYGAIVPKDVTYEDVLTQRNASTFAAHNANWNNDDPHNVESVQKAMRALGDKSYGMKFGALMDW